MQNILSIDFFFCLTTRGRTIDGPVTHLQFLCNEIEVLNSKQEKKSHVPRMDYERLSNMKCGI